MLVPAEEVLAQWQFGNLLSESACVHIYIWDTVNMLIFYNTVSG